MDEKRKRSSMANLAFVFPRPTSPWVTSGTEKPRVLFETYRLPKEPYMDPKIRLGSRQLDITEIVVQGVGCIQTLARRIAFLDTISPIGIFVDRTRHSWRVLGRDVHLGS